MEENKVAHSLGSGFKLFNTWLQGLVLGLLIGFAFGVGMAFEWKIL